MKIRTINGNANLEDGFSVNKNLMRKSETSINGLHFTKDAIKLGGGE